MFTNKNFPGREEKEKIVCVLRRHWVVELWIFIRYLVLAAIPVLIYFYLNYYSPDWQTNNETYGLAILLVSIYYLGVLLFFFNTWVDYYLDVWIITNLKIISVEQRRLFSRQISRMRFNRMQDVTCETKGFFATIFKFGDVHIQTAGAEERFILKQVPNPNEVTKLVIKLAHEAKEQPQPHENSTL